MKKLALIFISYEFVRYLLNGTFATLVHFIFLKINIVFFEINSVGFANGIASIFGISASFIGNRYFVFSKIERNVFFQIKRFIPLYISIAVLNTIVLFLWSDLLNLNYVYGFLVATFLQVILSYFGNKFLVF